MGTRDKAILIAKLTSDIEQQQTTVETLKAQANVYADAERELGRLKEDLSQISSSVSR